MFCIGHQQMFIYDIIDTDIIIITKSPQGRTAPVIVWCEPCRWRDGHDTGNHSFFFGSASSSSRIQANLVWSKKKVVKKTDIGDHSLFFGRHRHRQEYWSGEKSGQKK